MKKVLVIRGSAIGDIIECLPVASALKSHFNEDFEVHWLVRRKFKKILEVNRFVDKILCFEDYKDFQCRLAKRFYKNKKFSNKVKSFLKFSSACQLRKEKYDIVINLHNEIYARIFSIMCDAPITINAPWIEAEDTVYNSNNHRIVENLETLTLLNRDFDISKFVKENIDYGWNFSEEKVTRIKTILLGKGCEDDGYIAIVLSTTWQSKNYPIENWIRLIILLQQINKKLVFVGDSKDGEIFNKIKSKINSESLIDLTGKTSLDEMIIILSKATIVVGGDTGPLHIASSLNVRTVTLMNPTFPDKYAPFGDKSVVLTANYPCKFCHMTKCPKSICCMKYIEPSEVYNIIVDLC